MNRGATIVVVSVLAACAAPGPGDTRNPTTGGTGTSSTSVTSTGVVTGTDERVTASGPIVCADPGARDSQVFNRHQIGDDWDKSADYRTPGWTLFYGGRGVVVADFDGDGVDDLLIPRDGFPSEFLLGNGDGTFTPNTEQALPSGNTARGFNGGSAADYDNDGDMDAMVYGLFGTGTIMENQGDGTFAWVEHPEWDTDGGPSQYGCGGSAAWADYDRDGDLDLYYGRLGGTDPMNNNEVFFCPSQLLESDGAGGFTAHEDRLDDDVHDIRIMVAGWDDFDGDGWLDIYNVSDAPPMPNMLLRNQADGTFQTQNGTGLEIVVAGMGLALGDLNEDEIPDVMVTGINELPTLVSYPDLGLWADSAAAYGLYEDRIQGQSVAWGGEFVDLDNDGYLDMVETYGDFAGSAAGRDQPDAIHRFVDDQFVHVGEDWGWDDVEVMRGFISVDLNDDGWLDIVKKELDGVVMVDVANCGEAAWMTIRLHDEANHNRHAIGARVRIRAGGRTWTRRVYAGSTSYCSGGPPEVHFGLGDLESVDAIEVEWPTGELTVHPTQPTRQFLDIRREL